MKNEPRNVFVHVRQKVTFFYSDFKSFSFLLNVAFILLCLVYMLLLLRVEQVRNDQTSTSTKFISALKLCHVTNFNQIHFCEISYFVALVACDIILLIHWFFWNDILCSVLALVVFNNFKLYVFLFQSVSSIEKIFINIKKKKELKN